MHTQSLHSLRTLTRDHELFELSLPVVARLVESVELMRYIVLYPMIGAVVQSFKLILNGTNNFDSLSEHNL